MKKQCSKTGCHNKVRAKQLCSTHYNQTRPNRHATRATTCNVCGTSIQRAVKNDRAHVCSVGCRKAWAGHKGTIEWSRSAVLRAKKHGAKIIEEFTDTQVYDRDGWICHLCDEPVSKTSDRFHPASATIDHIIPLSKGGNHTLDNVACAHLKCNSSKQDKDHGQQAA